MTQNPPVPSGRASNGKPKVSILMITYNHEAYIRQAIESVLAQKADFAFELVVGEDRSTDKTREILVELTSKHPDVIVPVLADRNQGWRTNFNAALAQCRGEYVAFLDGDDYWIHEGKLQMQAQYLDQDRGSALCFTKVRKFDVAGIEPDVMLPQVEVETTTEINDIASRQYIQICSVMARRTAIEPMPRWFEGLALGDWPMFILAARHGSIGFLDEVTAAYRLHSGGIWSGKDPILMCREIIRMFERLHDNIEARYRKLIRSALSKEYFELAWRLREKGKHHGAKKAISKCISLRRFNPFLPKLRAWALWAQCYAKPIYRLASGFRAQ